MLKGEVMDEYTLIVDLPFLPKGAVYQFDKETGFVYRVVAAKPFEYPLRNGLAGYLWLLLTEKAKYFV